MADITMCNNWEGCPMAESCLRATAKADRHGQAYAYFEHRMLSGAANYCKDHMSNSTVETKTNPPIVVVEYLNGREQLPPAQEWEAWITQCMERVPKINAHEEGSLWAAGELTRLRNLLIEKEKSK